MVMRSVFRCGRCRDDIIFCFCTPHSSTTGIWILVLTTLPFFDFSFSV